MDSSPSLPLILGPLLLGSFFGWTLFGGLCLQTYLYYRWYPDDHIVLKLLVLVIAVLEIADTGISIEITWVYMVSTWGNKQGLFAAPWSFCVAVILTGIIAVVSQSFFARRLWLLSHSISIIVLIMLLSSAQCISAIVGSVQVLSVNLRDSSKLSTFDVFSIWLSCSAACDLLIAGSMVYYLSKRKSHVMIGSTDYLITRLINFSMQTGIFTAVCAGTTLILSLTSTNTNLKDGAFLPLGKLYANAVLANLNARSALFSERDNRLTEDLVFTDNPQDLPLSTVRGSGITKDTLSSIVRDTGCQTGISLESPSRRR